MIVGEAGELVALIIARLIAAELFHLTKRAMFFRVFLPLLLVGADAGDDSIGEQSEECETNKGEDVDDDSHMCRPQREHVVEMS